MIYKFQNIEVCPQSRELLRDGDSVSIEPKVFDLLLYLIENKSRAVDKRELLEYIWPEVYVSESSLTRCIMKARKALNDDNPDRPIIKTVHGHGYRFHGELLKKESQAPTRKFVQLPDRPSIAVLPFVNMSSDPDQEHFADGMSEDIITALSKTPKLFVIARNSTFTYKGRAVDVKDVGREQGVKYVLEGSVQRAGDRLRITSQLIDAATGLHVWADRYDRTLSDIFDLQDEITREIVSALQVNLTEGEQAEIFSRGTTNLLAWEKVIRAHDLINVHTQESVSLGQQLAQEAIKIDPIYSSAYTALAYAHFSTSYGGWSEDPLADIQITKDSAENAIRLNNRDGLALAILSMIHVLERHFEYAQTYAERALACSPNNAYVMGMVAMVKMFCDETETAVSLVKKAMRHCPIYPAWMPLTLSASLIALDRAEDAVDAGEEAKAIDSSIYRLHHVLAESYAGAGRMADAQRAVETLMQMKPDFCLAYFAAVEPYKNPATTKKLMTYLKAAGVPDQ